MVQVNQNDVDIDLLWKKVTAFIERCSKKKDRRGLVPLYALQAMASSIRHNLPLLQNSSFQYCCNSGITYFGAVLRSQLRKGKEKESRIMLEAILSLITVIDSMKEQYVPMHDSDAIKRMLINCLKHGINDEGDSQITMLCLIIVRQIIVVFFDDKSSLKNSKSILHPHQVFAMVVKHSNFEQVAMKIDSETRRELISLLICCLVLDTEHSCDLNMCDILTLFRGFTASLNYPDILLRRLVLLYEARLEKPSYYLSELRWRKNDVQNSCVNADSAIDEDWGWMVEMLDLRRIRQTLNNFPIDDAIDAMEFNEEQKTYDSFDCDRHNNPINMCPPVRHSIWLINKEPQDVQHFRPDDRYSPGFIVPMILAALESFATNIDKETDKPHQRRKKRRMNNDEEYGYEEDDNASSDLNSNDNYTTSRRYDFVNFSFCLIQKGALALTLCSLSSKCASLRKVAIALVLLFTRALKMDEARLSKFKAEWKERPQLEMVLNAVQRGLAVRRAIDTKKMDGFLTPKMPVVSSLFLARSLFILSRPGDEMYSQINKFFLRIDDHHGAYTDCHSLPAFMSFFCANRVERLWSLQLLKDGSIDEYCYSVIARRHAPELILTSLESVFGREETMNEEKESLLLLDTFQNILISGRLAALQHLFNMGFFSWIQCIIHTKLCSPEVSYEVRCKFLQILQRALFLLKQKEKTAHIDTISFARSIINLFAHPSKINGTGRLPLSDVIDDSNFVTIVCDILLSLQSIGALNMDRNTHRGVVLQYAFSFLEAAKEECLASKVAEALCYFPIETSQTDFEVASSFIILCLQLVVNQHHKDGTSIDVYVLKSITKLLKIYESQLCNKSNIFTAILSVRIIAMQSRECKNAWLDCFNILRPVH